MIIVSQNKADIINFDNITHMYFEPNDNTINVLTEYDDYISIGKYKTKKRAKEVLREIINSYRDYRTAECDGYTNVLQETAVYEMPEG